MSGAELAYRAFHQAIGFGADIVYGKWAVALQAARGGPGGHTQAVAGYGDGHLAGLTLQDDGSERTKTVPVTACSS